MKYPIRVLHVLGGLNRGGAETMVMNLYRNIDRSKVQFDFIVHTKNKCDYDEEIKALGGRIYSIPKYNGKNHLHYKKEWYKFLKEHTEYRIIHGHVRSTASIYLKIAKKLGRKTIAHSHNTSSGHGISAIVKNILQYRIRYIADYLFACSLISGEWLFGKEACKQNNFYLIKNAIDTDQYIFNNQIRDKIRKKIKVEDKFVIGHIGRFHLQKNHNYLIEIFKEIYDINKNSILMLIGDGELRSSIEKKINDLGLSDNVILTGVIDNVSELLQAMDVFVFPSLYEGLPVTLVEAQATGLQCFISDTITSEINISPYINSLSLSSTAKEWANNIINYEKVSREDTKYYMKSSGYDIDDTVNNIFKFYTKLAFL